MGDPQSIAVARVTVALGQVVLFASGIVYTAMETPSPHFAVKSYETEMLTLFLISWPSLLGQHRIVLGFDRSGPIEYAAPRTESVAR